MNHRSPTLQAVRRRRGDLAWLAVVAVLINILLPTAFVVGAERDGSAVAVAFCGAAHDHSGPDRAPGTPGGPHCIFCLVAGVAPAPAPPAAPAAPQVVGTAGTAEPPGATLRPTIRFAAAQPRGPPAAA